MHSGLGGRSRPSALGSAVFARHPTPSPLAGTALSVPVRSADLDISGFCGHNNLYEQADGGGSWFSTELYGEGEGTCSSVGTLETGCGAVWFDVIRLDAKHFGPSESDVGGK